MKDMKSFLISATLLIILITAWGCGTGENIVAPETTITPGAYTSVEDVMDIIKGHTHSVSGKTGTSDFLMAPKSGKYKKTQKIKKNEGGDIKLKVSGIKDKVIFKVNKKSLAKDTTITMELYLEVDKKRELGTLYFEFGPSGTQFNPHAQLTIPFELFLTDDVDTLVVTDENGDQVDGCSYDVDYKKGEVITYIPHFSKYHYCRRR